MRNRVHLIAYADRCGGDLGGLAALLRGPWSGVYGGVHVLPFYTPYDGADAGFDPIDHTEVDPRLGSWDDIADIARDHVVMVDVIVNHVSADSAAFRDVRERGDASRWASMFLTLGTVFPEGARESDLTAIYRPRPGLPFTPMVWGTTMSVTLVEELGADAFVYGDAQASDGSTIPLIARAPGSTPVRLGDTVHVQARKTHVFAPDGDRKRLSA